ncbi:hypothetical protein [Saccharibacillus kuerlensis]|uniref:SbsC C-terminal domain-containing protein n=1 Tax=Saccharibacillus kuerlensis TaxID=459527 RepID=A0ABQ2KXP4_9BACL|nr:hypothetical protein [Saccharibacillus kuerlensis]GGN95764.1 hypothetical protein GCM10010969_11960 [Saccharibacillus kuerlensis]
MKEQVVGRKVKAVSAAFLASVVAFGGIGFTPPVQAVEAQTIQQTDLSSFAYLSDPARTKLIDLNAMREISTSPAQSSDFVSVAYYQMLGIQHEAAQAVMDPTTSQARLQAIARQYELRLADYQDFYLKKFWVDRYLFVEERAIWSSVDNESELTPEDRKMLDVIGRTFAQIRSNPNPTDKDYRDAYVDIYAKYILERQKLNPTKDPGWYGAQLAYIREDVETKHQAALSAGSTEDYSASLQEVDQALSNAEHLLANSASITWLEIALADARAKAENAIEAFDPYVPQRPFREESFLTSLIQASKNRMDSPKGINPGEYPASAFGALRRAINEAERSLEKGKTRADFGIALAKLYEADTIFLNSRKQ